MNAEPAKKADLSFAVADSHKRRRTNKVRQDGMLKEIVHQQEKAKKTWQEKWGFIKDFSKFYEEQCIARGLPQNFIKQKAHYSMLEYKEINIPPSPPVPTTSSAFIGWRSSLPQYKLETAGPMYISPLQTLDPPNMAKPLPQTYIYIG